MKTKILMLLLLFVFSSTATYAARDRADFTVLKGKEAASFRLPANVQHVATRNIKSRDLVAQRYQQMLGDAQVLGGQFSVYRDNNGDITSVLGAFYPGLLSSNEIKINANAAKSLVAKKIGGQGKWLEKLMINPKDGRYFYIVENQRPDSRWFHWIDAENSHVINAYDGLTTGSGTGVLGDVKDLTNLTSWSNGKFQMKSDDSTPTSRQITYDAQGKNRLPGILAVDSDDLWDRTGRTSPGQAALVDAHFYARVTDNYLLAKHGFNWLDAYPQGMVSSAHVQRNYNNAYWNGRQMAYGDGDGVNFINLSADLDVVGHELSHGVTEATSNLIYQDESGALNEAFSDIMGTNIEFYFGTGNWTIGEDITPNTNGIRNMQDPAEDGDPAHYDDRYTGSNDNGGVHSNSGIINHWYYLLVTGGVELVEAEKIVFDGFTSLTANANFCAARSATLNFSGEYTQPVATAWDAVGVTDIMCNGGTDTGTGEPPVGDGPVISAVGSRTLKGVKFQIYWTTDISATTEITFTCCGTYKQTELVTKHSYNFSGSKGANYEFYVTSEDINGQSSTSGPFNHQN